LGQKVLRLLSVKRKSAFGVTGTVC
jgi:hypothetical protein